MHTQDPYVQLSLENDWIAKTDVKPNAGRSAAWADITDMELPVTGDILKYKKITVTVFDKNSMGKDSWMGQGEFSLRKLGSNAGKPIIVSHLVWLKDKRGKAAGKVTVDAELQPLPEVAEAAKAEMLQTVGILSLLECAVSKLAETGLVRKQDLTVKLALAGWKKSTEVNKGAGTDSVWSLKMNTTPHAVAQLLKPGGGLSVEVVGHSVKGDSMLGKAIVPLDKAVAQPGRWVDLVADLQGQTTGSGSVGKFRVKARFSPEADAGALDFPGRGDEGYKDLQSSQAELNNRVGSMEQNITAQLHKELAAEKDSILQAMALQGKALSQSIENLARELAKERKAKAALLDGLVVNQVNSLKLPADVKQWRSAHVQAWISFQMELPDYAVPFQKASIDGLVLLKHITKDTLQKSLEITDQMHCDKILEGIQVLQKKQKQVDAQAEKDRLKRLQAKKEEEDRKRAAMAELQKQAEKKEKKVKKKKKASKPTAKTYFGEVREQNVLERARIERDMRLYRTEKQKQQHKADLASRTWKFEYTGAPQPTVETIWDSDPFAKKMGSSAYRRTMAMDILGSHQFTATDALPRAPASIKVRPVPRNCSPEEVLALVKGAMFDVSEWLLEMDRIERRRKAALDSDLADANDEAFLGLLTRDADTGYDYEEDGYAEEEPPALEDFDLEEESEAPPEYSELVGSNAKAFSPLDSTSEAPPAYNEVLGIAEGNDKSRGIAEEEGQSSGDEEDELPPPPAYEEVIGDPPARTAFTRAYPQSPSPPTNAKLLSMIQSGAGDLHEHTQQEEPDRMTVIFQALVGQQNNNARWLGANEKLTRMKLYGGFESLLRLKVEWTQFDALWTQLDYKRSGDIDVKEFKAFFGDLAEFKTAMGTQALSTTAKSKSIAALSRCLFELCDALRHAGFTVVEMFSGFDRNGSGGVSISEFCSMLRLVVGNNFEKRLIYQALSVLDTNGDKSISLEEVLRFVYRVWKSQLDELAEKLSRLDEHMTGEAEKIQKVIEERRQIKEAIKKNFPREWRDRLEREGGHTIPGPFQALLQRMDIGDSTMAHQTASRTALSGPATAFGRQAEDTDSPPRVRPSSESVPASPQQQHRSYRPSETWASGRPGSPGGNPTLAASAPLPIRPKSAAGNKMTSHQLSVAGQNEIMRFKIKVPAGCAPTRTGAQLQIPRVRDLTAGPVHSSEVTDSILRKNAPFEGYG
jgi:hypothetical protein